MQQFAGAVWHKIPFPTLQWLTGWKALSLSLSLSFPLSTLLCLSLSFSGSNLCFELLSSLFFFSQSHPLFLPLVYALTLSLVLFSLFSLTPVFLSFSTSQPCFQIHPYPQANTLPPRSTFTILTLSCCLCPFSLLSSPLCHAFTVSQLNLKMLFTCANDMHTQ